jgi:1,4-dihydroxy-2-naphthoate octaprenyltransferase
MSLQVIVALWRMSRPLMLLSIFLVYVTGTLAAVAGGQVFDLSAFLWGWAALLPLSISIHYVNEYADSETDCMTQRTAFSGGSGVIPGGLVTRGFALRAAWTAALLGIGIALLGLIDGALNPTAVGILTIGGIGGWMYSVWPLKLAWRGWGELDNAVLGGLILPLLGFTAQTGGASMLTVLSFVPFTLLVFANLLATTWADRQADVIVGKYTLATFVPPGLLRAVYMITLVLSALIFMMLVGIAIPTATAWLAALTLPFMVWGAATYTRLTSPHPSVFLMIVYLIAQLIGYGGAALGRSF